MKSKKNRQPPFYLLTGVLIGILTGIILALIFRPVYVDASPAALNDVDKINLRGLIAQAYAADHDLGRAKARLALLQDKTVSYGVILQAQQELSANGPDNPRVKALSILSTAFAPTQDKSIPTITPTPVNTDTPEDTATVDLISTATPTFDANRAIMTATPKAVITATPKTMSTASIKISASAPTFTPQVTASPLSSLGDPFILAGQTDVCDPNLTGLVQIEVVDKSGNYVPGVGISITWEGGEDHFYTGLHPNINAGYADFNGQATISYSVKVGDIGTPVDKLTIQKCTAKDGSTYVGGLMLHFSQK